jgi:hypothetical protein
VAGLAACPQGTRPHSVLSASGKGGNVMHVVRYGCPTIDTSSGATSDAEAADYWLRAHMLIVHSARTSILIVCQNAKPPRNAAHVRKST